MCFGISVGKTAGKRSARSSPRRQPPLRVFDLSPFNFEARQVLDCIWKMAEQWERSVASELGVANQVGASTTVSLLTDARPAGE